METIRLTESLSIDSENPAAREALAQHLDGLRVEAQELGLVHLGVALEGVLRRLREESFGAASLLAARVLASRFDSLAAIPSVSGTHPVPAAGERLRGRRVLVADDDAEVRWFYVGVLREAGAKVVEAADGQQAIELAREDPPDLILADILMPWLDGLGLCAAVRREPRLDGVPVVLLSWQDDFLHRMRELRADAQDYLRKEVPAQQILDRVSGVLEPLVRLEGALEGEGEARGDLEELGVSTLLRAVRRLRPNAGVVLQDPWSLFEVELCEGRIVGVAQTGIDGTVTDGAAALPALVGMGSGRFVVAEHAEPSPVEAEPLDAAFDAATARLSTLIDKMTAHPDCRIGFEPRVLGAYVRHSPKGVQALIGRLANGEPPRALWESSDGSRALVDALLVTLARQGAVEQVVVPVSASEPGPLAASTEEELIEPQARRPSRRPHDPIERENLRAQSAVAMHREPVNRVAKLTDSVWRLKVASRFMVDDDGSGFELEAQSTSRILGWSFVIVFCVTVVFLLWRAGVRSTDSGQPSVAEAPALIPAGKVVEKAPPRFGGIDLTPFIGTLRAEVDPSLEVSEGQGVLDLAGPADVGVDVDGVERGELPLKVVLDEGTHMVRYRIGSETTYRFYYVKAGATRVLRVSLAPGGFVDAR